MDSLEEHNERYLNAKAVQARYATTDMSIWRWIRDERIAFPPPSLTVNRTRLWRLSDLLKWERERVASALHPNKPPRRHRAAAA
jgi:predicted DNA-binding transcriptional regulator AlpA